MGFLQRSKSAAVGEPEQRWKQDQAVAEQRDVPTIDGPKKQRVSQERPKTADDRRSRSFSRPRTATGISRTTERSFDLDIRPPMMEFKAGDETFAFPTPSPRLPPKSATFPLPPPVPSKSGSPQIGVALGSPGHPPVPSWPSWGRSFTADHISTRMPVQPQPSRAPPAIPEQSEGEDAFIKPYKKTSSWKTFGGIFGRGRKSHKKIDEPFYSLKVAPHPDQPSDYLVAPGATVRRFSPARSPLSQPTLSFEGPRHLHQLHPMPMTRGMARLEARAEATLASFNSNDKSKKMRSPSVIQKEGFSPMFRALNECRDSEDMFRAPKAERNDSPLSMNEKVDEKLTSPRTPRLDLDLPDPKFERYSVMFEKLLEEPKLSLLERRQSKLQRRSVKTLATVSSADEDALPPAPDTSTMPQRSVTSPHIKKALSIRVGAAIHRPRPIQRSNTAPPNAQSPLAQTFSRAKAALRTLSPRSPTFQEALPTTPLTTATFSDTDSVAIINNDRGRVQRNLDQAEPAWDMITSEPTKLSPEKVSNPYRRVKTPEDLERNIVQVSVARQVSVSRARRQVQQSVTSKQPLRPRVVELTKDKDRKSTVVLIESGDD